MLAAVSTGAVSVSGVGRPGAARVFGLYATRVSSVLRGWNDGGTGTRSVRSSDAGPGAQRYRRRSSGRVNDAAVCTAIRFDPVAGRRAFGPRTDGLQYRTDSSASADSGSAAPDSADARFPSMRLPTSMTIGSTDTATINRKIRSILSRTTAI